MKSTSQIRSQAFSRWKDAKDASRTWRKDAREDYEFYSGRQWGKEDEAYLREAGRPIITFNRTAPFVDAIVGNELSNRMETTYSPRTVEPQDLDGRAAEMFTETGRWMRQSCDADDSETQAYKDCLIAGMGWTEARLDYDEDPDGKFIDERISPFEMYWTAGASKPNLTDATDVWRVRKMPMRDIKMRWPKAKINWEDVRSWADNTTIETPHDSTPPAYDEDSGAVDDMRRGQVTVVHYQWCDKETYLRTSDPDTGDYQELDPEKADDFRQAVGNDHPITRQQRKRWHFAIIIGNQVVDSGELFPGSNGEVCPGPSFKTITGKWDENKGYWHGIVRAAKDPQRWANKFYSQIQDVINSNAKGGIIAETDAFENMRQAEQNWAKPDAIVWASPGAIAGQKIIDRKPANYPTGLDKLMNVAIEAIPMTTGVSYEMLGITGTNQPNVLEKTRIGRSMTVLAQFASSLRGFRKQGGRLLLHIMRNFVPAEVLARVSSMPDAQQLLDADVAKYDVVVDQSPTSPTLKEDVWGSVMQILPQLIQAGIPFPMTMLDFLPLPETVIQKLKAELQQQAQDPMKQQQQQLGIQQQAADVEKTKADAQKSVMTGQAAIMGAKTNVVEAFHEITSPEPAKPPPNIKK